MFVSANFVHGSFYTSDIAYIQLYNYRCFDNQICINNTT